MDRPSARGFVAGRDGRSVQRRLLRVGAGPPGAREGRRPRAGGARGGAARQHQDRGVRQARVERGRAGCAGPGLQELTQRMPDDLAEVYRTTYQALVRFLYRKVWDPHRAEDLAQEAFARAVVHKPTNPRGWLFVVAANMARDDARRAARERRHLTLLKSEPPPTAPPSDEGLHEEDERSRVRAALDLLTPRDREVLLLWDA